MLAFSQQQVKTKCRSGIAQAQGYLPHVDMFCQWKHWIQITSRLNSSEDSDDFACACLRQISFSLGSSLLAALVLAIALTLLVKTNNITRTIRFICHESFVFLNKCHTHHSKLLSCYASSLLPIPPHSGSEVWKCLLLVCRLRIKHVRLSKRKKHRSSNTRTKEMF